MVWHTFSALFRAPFSIIFLVRCFIPSDLFGFLKTLFLASLERTRSVWLEKEQEVNVLNMETFSWEEGILLRPFLSDDAY